ncbi:hypothetical protein V2J09_007456 [Rumex salicifolius]
MASVLFYCEPEDLYCNDTCTGFLNTCSMCNESLHQNDDVFMYQGITAFCSEDCRQRQIDIDHPPRRRARISASWQPGRPSSGAVAGKSIRTAGTGSLAEFLTSTINASFV